MKLYVVSNCDDQGEYQGVIDDKDNILDVWSSNDGDIRVEYHRGVFAALGHELLSSDSPRHSRMLRQYAIQCWGDNGIEDTE